jgi:hypothetical protein
LENLENSPLATGTLGKSESILFENMNNGIRFPDLICGPNDAPTTTSNVPFITSVTICG